jgi:hypothetical protein
MLGELGFVLVAGIKFGALYALAALGLVVVHKGDENRQLRPRRVRHARRVCGLPTSRPPSTVGPASFRFDHALMRLSRVN